MIIIIIYLIFHIICRIPRPKRSMVLYLTNCASHYNPFRSFSIRYMAHQLCPP